MSAFYEVTAYDVIGLAVEMFGFENLLDFTSTSPEVREAIFTPMLAAAEWMLAQQDAEDEAARAAKREVAS